MNILIELRKDSIIIWLKSRKRTMDKLEWRENLNLSQKLLLKIDKILVANNLTPSDISSVSVESNISDNLTTVRIAEIVAKSFNYYRAVN
jgi:hypothetical protein